MEINLFEKTFEDLEDFISKIHFKENKETYTFTTGEIGMLLFARLVHFKLDLNKYEVVAMTYRTVGDEVVDNGQFVIYKMPNGINIKIEHEPTLDKAEDIDEKTGYPKKASTLYYHGES